MCCTCSLAPNKAWGSGMQCACLSAEGFFSHVFCSRTHKLHAAQTGPSTLVTRVAPTQAPCMVTQSGSLTQPRSPPHALPGPRPTLLPLPPRHFLASGDTLGYHPVLSTDKEEGWGVPDAFCPQAGHTGVHPSLSRSAHGAEGSSGQHPALSSSLRSLRTHCLLPWGLGVFPLLLCTFPCSGSLSCQLGASVHLAFSSAPFSSPSPALPVPDAAGSHSPATTTVGFPEASSLQLGGLANLGQTLLPLGLI